MNTAPSAYLPHPGHMLPSWVALQMVLSPTTGTCVRYRRRVLDLTQAAFAQRVTCAEGDDLPAATSGWHARIDFPSTYLISTYLIHRSEGQLGAEQEKVSHSRTVRAEGDFRRKDIAMKSLLTEPVHPVAAPAGVNLTS